MKERILLVSTCGTSLLTNGASEDDRKWLGGNANKIVVDPNRLESIVAPRRAELKTADLPKQRRMSAEINGVSAVLDRYMPKQVFHLVVHTDTALGTATAELVQAALGDQVALLSASGLRTDHLGSFRAALADLTKDLDENIRTYREKDWSVVFNLTGGFKSLNGYLQTLGMLLADRCVFLFEGSSELMEIPRLPVRLTEIDELRDHAEIFRLLDLGYSVAVGAAARVPDALLMEDDGFVTTSVLGDVAWRRHRATLFAERLHAPLSQRVRVGAAVQRAFTRLEADKKVHVNEALDEFCADMDKVRVRLKSRLFKPLQGKPISGSTHELYAWSDGGAGRLFGHYDEETFVFDHLGPHL